jgi:HD-like signal output (HDOD) protein
VTIKAVYFDDNAGGSLPDFSACATSGFDVSMVTTPEQASAALASGNAEVLVAATGSEPGTAIELLTGAAAAHPEVGRMALTDHPTSLPPGSVHQYLVSPFDSEQLRVQMLTTAYLRDRVPPATQERLRDGSVKLPALPEAYLRIQEALRSKDASVAGIGQIIKQDPAVSIKVLQIVNSSLYGLRTEIGDITHAASLLGINTLTALVLAVGVFKQVQGLDRRFIEELWRNSIAASGLARQIARHEGLDRCQVEASQLAALLHDIGDLVLMRNWRDEFAKVRPEHRDADEITLFGASHADLGGYLCVLWGLPGPVIAAVAHHHHPALGGARVLGPTTVVHAAQALIEAGLDPHAARVDHDHLSALGYEGKLETWASLAA